MEQICLDPSRWRDADDRAKEFAKRGDRGNADALGNLGAIEFRVAEQLARFLHANAVEVIMRRAAGVLLERFAEVGRRERSPAAHLVDRQRLAKMLMHPRNHALYIAPGLGNSRLRIDAGCTVAPEQSKDFDEDAGDDEVVARAARVPFSHEQMQTLFCEP